MRTAREETALDGTERQQSLVGLGECGGRGWAWAWLVVDRGRIFS